MTQPLCLPTMPSPGPLLILAFTPHPAHCCPLPRHKGCRFAGSPTSLALHTLVSSAVFLPTCSQALPSSLQCSSARTPIVLFVHWSPSTRL